MLSPDDRTLLVDLLVPPEGFHLQHAVATTFTLHLTALLPVPLGFAGMDLTSATDPLGVLQAIRSYSDRIDVFCQAGMVSVPAQRNDLITYLEPIVHQVVASPGRLFHPKLWVLRYGNDEGEQRFRLICGSRNLTHDKAWDAIISLDGTRTGRRHAVNKPIGELLTSLASRVPNGVPDDRRRSIETTSEELQFVEWERPEGVLPQRDWLTFHVFGRGRRTSPNFDGYRRLVVSPFINSAGLDTVWPEWECTIVSRAETFDALDSVARTSLEENDAILRVLDEGAALPDIESDDAGARWSLSGLHAKLYVVERAKVAHVFIGSANATDAAWHGNDEVLVELAAKVGSFGVFATVGGDEPAKGRAERGFEKILKPHLLGDPPKPDADADLQLQLERALRDFAAIPLTATIEIGPVEGAEPTSVGLMLSSTRVAPDSPGGAVLTVGLLTRPGDEHRPPSGELIGHRWALPAIEDITPFVVLRLTAGSASRPIQASCVTLARLVGDPPDRFDRILARRLGTPEEFLRFLLLLLQLAGEHGEFPAGTGTGSFDNVLAGPGGSGVLESLVGALATEPRAIDEVDRLVSQLAKTEAGRQVLPDGWDELWASITEARARLTRRR